MSAVVAKASSTDACNFGAGLRPLRARRGLVGAKASQRIASERGIRFRDFPYQFEKEGQGTRRVFMLQCTILR